MEKTDWDFESELERVEKEFGLPDFGKLASDFDVEKVLDKETDFLVREIRRTMGEKVAAYLHFFEMFMNPASPPVYMFSALKKINGEHRDMIKNIYEHLAKLQIKGIKLDTVYSEKSEADFVNETFSLWQDLKHDIFKIVSLFEGNFELSAPVREKGYFS